MRERPILFSGPMVRASARAWKIIYNMPDKKYNSFLTYLRDALSTRRKPRTREAFGKLLKSVALADTGSVSLKSTLLDLSDWEWRNLAESISWALDKKETLHD